VNDRGLIGELTAWRTGLNFPLDATERRDAQAAVPLLEAELKDRAQTKRFVF
jgi:hypothetical protein